MPIGVIQIGEQKKFVVPWSGGVDSTMALYQCLKFSNPHTVRAISFDVHQIAHRQRMHEWRARKKIKKWFEKKFGYRFDQQTIEVKLHGTNVLRGRAPQPVLWVGLLAAAMESGETAVFSWLKTDYDPQTMADLLGAWKNLAAANGVEPEPELPFLSLSKARVQQDAAELGVLEYCWSCESNQKARVGVVCGQCECCLSFQAGELERKMRTKKQQVTLRKPRKKK